MTRRRRSRSSVNLPAVIASGLLLVFAVVTLAAVLFVRSADGNRRSMRHIEVAIGTPLEDLGAAIEANTAGQALLQHAVVATGDRRSEMLAQSIAAAEAATASWTSFRGSSLNLPGEADLAAAYERDYEAGKAVAAEALVPIIQSSTPGFLPADQIDAAELNRANLLALQQLYEAEQREALEAVDRQQRLERNVVLVGATGLGVIVIATFAIALRAARRAAGEQCKERLKADLADLEGQLLRAYDLAEDEADAFRVAARALSDSLPSTAVSIVVADATESTFTHPVGVPSCGVEDVERCPASRELVPMQFSDSGSLDTCPVLASGASTPCSVTCVPVTVAGMRAAVVQLGGPIGSPPDMGTAVPLIARLLGAHLTTTREFARVRLQASHDPLTGLLNRRSLLEAVAQLHPDDSYAVAFADLDHFKLLNDVHGHDIGDRALRAFAATLKTCLRPDDLAGRWGGEEFVLVLPRCDLRQAIDAMDRVRARLAFEAREGASVAVTVSVGVALRDHAEPFDLIVARADRALRVAKAAGRDRVEAWKPRLDPAGEATPDEVPGTTSGAGDRSPRAPGLPIS